MVTTFEIVNINPMTGFDADLDDAQIGAAAYLTIGNVINRIDC